MREETLLTPPATDHRLMPSTRPRLGASAAAFLALLMLTYASIQSSVMRATMAPSIWTELCGGVSTAGEPMAAMAMPGMAESRAAVGASPRGKARPGHANPSACPYCAAAAHPPVLASVTPLRTPVAFVFASFQRIVGDGPRGPPPVQPRARGPPLFPQPL